MAKIFIADRVQQNSFTQNLLQKTHDVTVATTLSGAAKAIKEQTFDLLIIDLAFDESRMCEALYLFKANQKNREKPVICISTNEPTMQKTFFESLDFATRAMGAWMFIDTNRRRVL